MDANATFVVEVIGELREGVDILTERVSDALALDDAKARLLVDRMPGVITKAMPETRAAKVALRLQAVGIAAVHRPWRGSVLPPGGSPYGPRHRAADLGAPPPPAVHRVDERRTRVEDSPESDHVAEQPWGDGDHHGRPADEDPAPRAREAQAAAAAAAAEAAEAAAVAEAAEAAAVAEAAEAAAVAEAAEAAAVAEAAEAAAAARAALAAIPSVDATLIEERDVRQDPKLTPMTEAGFGAADIMVPTMATNEWPAPRARRFTAPIVEGGATAMPEARVVRAEAPDDPAATMIRSPSAEPDDRAEPGERDVPLARFEGPPAAPVAEGAAPRSVTERVPPPRPTPERGAPASQRAERGSPERPSERSSPERPSAGVGAPRRDGSHGDGDTRATPARERPPSAAMTSRARETIQRDRAVQGAQHGGRERPPLLPDDDALVTPPAERAYRSKRSASESLLTLTPPPDAVLKLSGVREEALAATFERRRGAFGRRLAILVALPMIATWGLGAYFLWLLLPPAARGEVWVALAAATAVAGLFGGLASGLATSHLARDVSRLRDVSERIAMGDLAHPVEVRSRDEIGDIAAAVERMRVSLQESLERLRRRGR